jgi:hypothetical protein
MAQARDGIGQALCAAAGELDPSLDPFSAAGAFYVRQLASRLRTSTNPRQFSTRVRNYASAWRDCSRVSSVSPALDPGQMDHPPPLERPPRSSPAPSLPTC